MVGTGVAVDLETSSAKVELTVDGGKLGSGMPLPKGGKAGSVP